MKYLVLSKGKSLARDAKAENISTAKEMLQKAMDSGKIDAAYGLVAGGTAWIINADSHAALARGLRQYHLAGVHDVEVHPIVDGINALGAFVDHKTANG